MSLKGLRFTLDVDGLGQKTFAVVNFVLRQRHTFPFVLDIDVASDSFGETAEKLLEKNATLTIWQGNTPQRYVSGIVNRHRYYDPEQGRYITQDPIGLMGGWNLYQYPLDPIQIIDPLGLSGWDGLGNWLSQPGMKEAYNHAAGEAEGSIAKPISEWEFSGWNVVKGSNHLGTNYINVYAMCKDQFDNTKSVAAKVFQTGLFPLNEIEAGKGIPDPSENIGSKSAPVNTAADCIENLVKAHSRALTCGSKNGYECFMDTVATPELGNKLCGKTE